MLCISEKFVSGKFPVGFSAGVSIVSTCLLHADGGDHTKLWYRQLQYRAQGRLHTEDGCILVIIAAP